MKIMKALSDRKIAMADVSIAGPDHRTINDSDNVEVRVKSFDVHIYEQSYSDSATYLKQEEANMLCNFIQSLNKKMIMTGKEYKIEIESELPF